jgi:hypothetical protein
VTFRNIPALDSCEGMELIEEEEYWGLWSVKEDHGTLQVLKIYE